MITTKQRAYLRGLAQELSCIFQVGKGGITEEMANQISNALEARELIKVKCLDNSEFTAREAADLLAEATESDVVCVIGNRFVLFRQSVKHPKIDIYV